VFAADLFARACAVVVVGVAVVVIAVIDIEVSISVARLTAVVRVVVDVVNAKAR